MNIEIGLLFAGIVCIISVITFIVTRQSSSKKDGDEWGGFKADVTNIKETVTKIETKVDIISEQYSNIRTDVEVVKRDLKTAFSKIDDIKVRNNNG